MSLMTNDDIRLYPHDEPVERLFRFIPHSVTPNSLTVLRLLLTPIVVLLLWKSSYHWAFIVFLLAALTDMLDGSFARVRKQITLWGTIADPVADKCLIGAITVYFILTGLPLWIGFMVLGIELIIIANAFRRQLRGLYASANVYGKIKMVLHVVGIGLLFLERLLGSATIEPYAIGVFVLSSIFALISFFTYGI